MCYCLASLLLRFALFYASMIPDAAASVKGRRPAGAGSKKRPGRGRLGPSGTEIDVTAIIRKIDGRYGAALAAATTATAAIAPTIVE